jgi:hypothetical protein
MIFGGGVVRFGVLMAGAGWRFRELCYPVKGGKYMWDLRRVKVFPKKSEIIDDRCRL